MCCTAQGGGWHEAYRSSRTVSIHWRRACVVKGQGGQALRAALCRVVGGRWPVHRDKVRPRVTSGARAKPYHASGLHGRALPLRALPCIGTRCAHAGLVQGPSPPGPASHLGAWSPASCSTPPSPQPQPPRSSLPFGCVVAGVMQHPTLTPTPALATPQTCSPGACGSWRRSAPPPASAACAR